MVQFSMKAEYDRGVQDERSRILELLNEIDLGSSGVYGELVRKINE